MGNLTESGKHSYCEKAIAMEGIARSVYLTLGEMLFNIRQDKLYEPHWSTWNEYCMEFKDFSQGSISKMIAVYETFVLKYGYDVDELAKAGGWTKLYAMTPHIQSREDADKWLGIAATLTRADLTKSLIEAKTGVDMSTCKHTNTYTLVVCQDCGEKIMQILP